MMKNSLKSPKRIVFIALPPIAEMDLVGPWCIFQDANHFSISAVGEPPYKLELFAAGEKQEITGDFGLTLKAKKNLRFLRGWIDTAVIVGGTGVLQVDENSEITNWLQKNIRKIRRLVSVCSGAFALAAAGIIDNRRATTHWRACQLLARKYPLVKVENGPIFVRDGNIYTSAGATAGIDLALELIEEDLGTESALELARNSVMFLRRPGGQAQFSASLAAQMPEREMLRELQIWIAENLSKSLSIRKLAKWVAMSERHFARVFMAEFGVTPARYVKLQRIERARHELEQSRRGQAEIARRCGLNTADNLRRIFSQELGLTPEEYRSRFSRFKEKSFG